MPEDPAPPWENRPALNLSALRLKRYLAQGLANAKSELDAASPEMDLEIRRRIMKDVWKKVHSRSAVEHPMDGEPPLPLTDPERNQQSLELVLGQLALVLTKTTELQDELRELQADAEDLVSEARRLGVTWNAIGEVAGITPQSAYQRWTSVGQEKHRQYQRKRRTPPPSEESDDDPPTPRRLLSNRG